MFEMIQTLPTTLSELKEIFEKKISGNESQIMMFDKMYREMENYKDNFLLEALHKPIIHNLIQLYDDFTALESQFKDILKKNDPVGSEGLSQELQQFQTNLGNINFELEEALYQMDVTPYEEQPEVLDLKLHKTLKVKPTNNPEEDRKVMKVSGSKIEMIQTNGDHWLGGKDWDDRIITYVAEMHEIEHGENPLSDDNDLSPYQDLQTKAIAAKESLSKRDRARIVCGYNGKTTRVELTREKFEELTSDLLERCRFLCEKVLSDAKKTWTDIDTILLVGGSTRMPMIREMVKTISGKEINPYEVNPDESVAIGAAIQATLRQISGDSPAAVDIPDPVSDRFIGANGAPKVTVIDGATHNLGIIVLNAKGERINDIIIPKMTPVPCEKAKRYVTRTDNQKTALIRVTQGLEQSDHIATLQANEKPIEVSKEKSTNIFSDSSTRPILKFPNGEEATNIQQLATLMEKNSHDATAALYRGYLEKSLGGIGEIHFANAARAVVTEFPNNRELGFMAMVQILSGKIRLQKGSEAGTPKKLARLIDQNWDQAKKLLYNGFISVWLRYVKQTQLAAAANDIQIRHKNEWDIGLEELVQKLDPQIGSPKLETNPTHINFGKVFAETSKHIHLEIKNAGRGFLYGNIRLASKLLGLELSSTIIRGNSVFTLKLNASYLTANRTHHTDLVVETNGDKLTLPISYYVHPIPLMN